MLELLRAKLDSLDAFNNQPPAIIKQMVKCIADPTVPDRIKIIFSVSELTTFTSQFRRNIRHWENFELPINAVSFGVMYSGAG